jgi:hypothetical protein
LRFEGKIKKKPMNETETISLITEINTEKEKYDSSAISLSEILINYLKKTKQQSFSSSSTLLNDEQQLAFEISYNLNESLERFKDNNEIIKSFYDEIHKESTNLSLNNT